MDNAPDDPKLQLSTRILPFPTHFPSRDSRTSLMPVPASQHEMNVAAQPTTQAADIHTMFLTIAHRAKPKRTERNQKTNGYKCQRQAKT